MRINWVDLLAPTPLVPLRRGRRVMFDDEEKKIERRRQQIAAAHRAWYERNKEEQKAKRRARYLVNRERDIELNRVWRENNRARQRLISKLWARKRRAELKAMGLTSRGRPIGVVNPSHFKKGWRAKSEGSIAGAFAASIASAMKQRKEILP